MDYPMQFIHAGPAYSTLTEYVPAPYLRKSFRLEVLPEKAELLICGLGFYELYVNGRRITKGLLSPYISNPDDLIYYDSYTVLQYLQKGENAFAWATASRTTPAAMCGILRKPASGEHRSWPWGWR